MRQDALVFSTLTLLMVGLPSWAQSERYATDTELEAVIEQHEAELPQLTEIGFYQDWRTQAERYQQSLWAAAWADVDAEIAPFLGHWVAIEEDIAVFPSANRGQVCVVDTHLDQSDFYLATVQDGKLYTDHNVVLVPTADFLLTVTVYDEPYFYPYNSPIVSTNPANYEFFADYHPDVVQQFEAAGCRTGLPQLSDR
ncbi:MAG: hypothetical protein F6K00_30525 [Leptolyngbya sp. SIOISBB]|nr:hypothetical protein [Leptolyngbya sp. SIOISBB]